MNPAAPPAALPRELLAFRHEDDRPETYAALGELVWKLVPKGQEIDAGSIDFRDIDALWAEAASDPAMSSAVRETLCYLRFQARAGTVLSREGIAARRHGEHGRKEQFGGLLEAVRRSEGDAAGYSAHMAAAKIASLHDRDAAAKEFAAARAVDPAFFRVIAHDHGAATYFSAATIESARAALSATRDQLLSAMRPARALRNADRLEHIFVFGADRHFLATYLPYWMSIAEALKIRGVGIHVLLHMPDGEAARTVDAFEALRIATARLRHAAPEPFCDNIAFSSLPVPSACRDPVTFYTCGRYLAARTLAIGYRKTVLVQDIDLVLRADPGPFLALLRRDAIGVSSSKLLYGLSPWRRIMAGLFVLPWTLGDLMEDAEVYICAGLTAEPSYYLDQNALAFLHERVVASNPAMIDDVACLVRPTAQVAVNGMLEEVQSDLAANH